MESPTASGTENPTESAGMESQAGSPPGPHKVLKIETLITRRCPLRCGYCQLINPHRPIEEAPVERWKEVFSRAIETLNPAFIPLYGGDPVERKDDCLELVKFFAAHGVHHSINATGVGYTKDDMLALASAGLAAWTVSVDSLTTNYADRWSRAKSKQGIRSIMWAKEAGVPDIAACCTVQRKNLVEIPTMLEYFTDLGVWLHLDVLHFGKQGFTFASQPDDLPPGLRLREQDLPGLVAVAERLQEMWRDGYLLHTTPQYLEGWKQIDYAVNQRWSCTTAADPGYPSFITVDADMTMMVCEDWPFPEGFRRWTLSEVVEDWEGYVRDWRAAGAQCPGCFWNPHLAPQAMHYSDFGVDLFFHDAKPGNLRLMAPEVQTRFDKVFRRQMSRLVEGR